MVMCSTLNEVTFQDFVLILVKLGHQLSHDHESRTEQRHLNENVEYVAEVN